MRTMKQRRYSSEEARIAEEGRWWQTIKAKKKDYKINALEQLEN